MDNYRYVYKSGKKLKTGYTTGSCAAAASKAAVLMLYSAKTVEQVEIDTPKGWRLKLDVHEPNVTETAAGCFIVKDAGDDPDITDGIRLYALAKRSEEPGISVKTGIGVGMVTKPGLSVKPGNPAINPIPMQMIHKEVGAVLPEGSGVEIELSIPDGERLALKTYNPKLGIVGGLSILGTSGIVEPMSEDAIKDTIAIELACRKEAGFMHIALVPGNYGEDFCRNRLHIKAEQIVKVSNYLGFALEKCAEMGFSNVLIAGHLGKLVKPAGGIFYTHSRISDTRMEILTAHLGVMGMPQEGLAEVMSCRTTEEAVTVIDRLGFQAIYQLIADKCADRCKGYVFDAFAVGVVLFSMAAQLACGGAAETVLEGFDRE